MSRFGDAAFAWMQKRARSEVASEELWRGLEADYPDLTTKAPTRKTPRTTCMRDLRKDSRFVVGGRKVALRD